MMPVKQFFVVQRHSPDWSVEFAVTSRERAEHMCRHLRLLYRNFPVTIHYRNSVEEKSNE